MPKYRIGIAGTASEHPVDSDPSQTQALRQIASARKAMARAQAAVEGGKSKQGVVVGTLGEVLLLLKQMLGVA